MARNISDSRLRVKLASLLGKFLALLLHPLLQRLFLRNPLLRRVFPHVLGDFHFPVSGPARGRGARRGNVLASLTSCDTFRIFSSKGSRASFCRISAFI